VWQWLYTGLFFVILCIIIKRWKFFTSTNLSPRFLQITLGLKFAAGCLLFVIYTNHYPDRSEADIFKYFDDSEVLYSSLWERPTDFVKMMVGWNNDAPYFYDAYYIEMNNWDRAYDSNVYNDSHTIIRFNALVRVFSFGIFHIHTLFFCFISLVGLTGLYKVFIRYFTQLKSTFTILLFYAPSVFLWTSGVLKESILIFALGILMYVLHKAAYHKTKPKWIVAAFVTLLFLSYIKFYVLIAFVPAIACYMLVAKTKWKSIIVYPAVLLTFGLLALNAKHIPPHIDMVKILERKQQDFKRLAEWQNAGSEFELTDIDQSIMGIIKVIPEGLLNCFVRPLPHNAKSVLYYPAILENLLVLLLLSILIYTSIKKNISPSNAEAKNFILLCFVFTLLLFTIIGITTPVAGALVRYKVPALPFLLGGMLLLLQNNRFLQSIEMDLEKIGV
jgi:hypothetical protein